MLRIILSLLILTATIRLCAQSSHQNFLETKRQTHLFYVDVQDSTAVVYQIGSYMDVGGSGYSLLDIDTLHCRDGNYSSAKKKLVTRDGVHCLVINNKRERIFALRRPVNPRKVNENLNNGYYLDAFFDMSDRLNKKYPLSNYSFRGGFSTWKTLPYKDIEHSEFRRYADARLKEMEDSISQVQDAFLLLTDRLVHNISSISYDSLKAGLSNVSPVQGFSRQYFGSVVRNVSNQRPEFFFRLAEEFPEHRDAIFASVDENGEVIERLKVVTGYDAVKKEFFKDRRFYRSMPYKLVGATVLTIGLVIFLIAR